MWPLFRVRLIAALLLAGERPLLEIRRLQVKDLGFPSGVRHRTAFEVPGDVAARLAAHSTEGARPGKLN